MQERDHARRIHRSSQIQTSGALTTILLNGNSAEVDVGGNGTAGGVSLENAQGVKTVHRAGMTPQLSWALLASVATYVKNDQGVETIHLGGADARIELGANGQDGDIIIKNSQGVETVFIGGGEARIELGADGQGGDVFVKSDEESKRFISREMGQNRPRRYWCQWRHVRRTTRSGDDSPGWHRRENRVGGQWSG